MKMSELDIQILDVCNDRTSKEIAQAAKANYRTVQSRIRYLKVEGYLDSYKKKSNAVNGFSVYYRRTDKPLEGFRPKEYQPLGMCVFGVWL